GEGAGVAAAVRSGPRHQLEEAGGRRERGAPAGGADRVSELEAFVAVQAEGQLIEWKVEAVGQHQGALEHVIVNLHALRSKTQSTRAAPRNQLLSSPSDHVTIENCRGSGRTASKLSHVRGTQVSRDPAGPLSQAKPSTQIGLDAEAVVEAV